MFKFVPLSKIKKLMNSNTEEPKIGETRIKTFFAWLPVTVDNYRYGKKTKWLEQITVEQIWKYSWDGVNKWKSIKFL